MTCEQRVEVGVHFCPDTGEPLFEVNGQSIGTVAYVRDFLSRFDEGNTDTASRRITISLALDTGSFDTAIEQSVRRLDRMRRLKL